jgi:XTP/dITP diphosphohydrolase
VTLQFVLATGNADKVREIVEIFGQAYGCTLRATPVECPDGSATLVTDARDPAPDPIRVGCAPNVEEDGGSLVANARIKASAWCGAVGLPAIADDTGLFVDALGGAPGVETATFAGVGATYEANVDKMLRELRDIPVGARGAYFATVAMAVFPDGHEVIAHGRADGAIATEAGGTTGFGYDPIFIPSGGDGRRFAEMTLIEKHERSHRGRAFRALAALLAETDLDVAGSQKQD